MRVGMAGGDLAGKVLKPPMYELLGGKGPGRVPFCDGPIYFSGLLPQYASPPGRG